MFKYEAPIYKNGSNERGVKSIITTIAIGWLEPKAPKTILLAYALNNGVVKIQHNGKGLQLLKRPIPRTIGPVRDQLLDQATPWPEMVWPFYLLE